MAKPCRVLESFWYQRLKDQGFDDIEDVSREGRPLKSWQSWQFIEEARHLRRARNAEYQDLIDSFNNREDFEEICTIVVKHGNSELTVTQVKQIWGFHCEGVTERQIAQRVQRSKTAVHKLLARLRDWMKLA